MKALKGFISLIRPGNSFHRRLRCLKGNFENGSGRRGPEPGSFQLRTGVILLLLLIILFAGMAPFQSFSIQADLSSRLQPMFSHHTLGTDSLGRDLFSVTLYGAGVSLLIAFTVIVLSAGFGTFVGLLSGFKGGRVDGVIMRAVDLVLAFPGLLTAILFTSIFGSGIITVVLALFFISWGGYARLARGEVLKHKAKDFVLTAVSYNASFRYIARHHLMPQLRALIIIQASLDVAAIILAESALNYLGMGLPPMVPTLGQSVSLGLAYLYQHGFLIVIPGTVLFILVAAFNFIGEGLRKREPHAKLNAPSN